MTPPTTHLRAMDLHHAAAWRRAGWVAAGLLALLLLATGCGPRYEPPLRLGTNNWLGYEPLYLARDLGYHDGLSLRLVELGSNTQTMDALRVGKLDMAGLTLDEALSLAQEGVPISIVWVLDVSNGADALVARQGITQLAGLRGQRIGVEQTAVGAYMLQAALRSAQLQVTDVTLVPLPMDEHVAAFTNGSVDAVVTFDPARQALLGAGAQVLFDSRALPGEIVDVLVARRAALECCAPRIRQLLQAQQRALIYLAEQRSDALVRMAPRLGLAPGDVGVALAGMALPDTAANHTLLAAEHPALQATAQRLAATMAERGLLAKGMDSTTLVNPAWARKVLP